MDKTYDFVINPPQNMTPWKHGKYKLFSRNWDGHKQNSQFKKFEKSLSSASADDEHP